MIRLRYPVVLMHGFGLLASMRRGGHLHPEALNLRLHGVLAYAPNVPAYNRVPIRAEIWKQRLESILEETGAQRLNLVAQSMGGLDARYLISKMGMHDVVAALVTVSTPHFGSSVASLVLEQPDRLQERAADFFNWMGITSLEGATADFQASVLELTPEFVRDRFNPEVPDHPAVQYFSYAGRAGKGTEIPVNPVLNVLNRLLYVREGVNDGFVSVESARWGRFMGTIDADHVRQVGIKLLSNSSFDSNEFYCSVARMLADEGF